MLYGARFIIIITLHCICAVSIAGVKLCFFFLSWNADEHIQVKNKCVCQIDVDYRCHRHTLHSAIEADTKMYFAFRFFFLFFLHGVYLVDSVYIWYDSLLRSLHTGVT